MAVPDIGKPAHQQCWWTTVHGGCAKQSEKATASELTACAQFQCLWLASQTHDDPSRRMGRHARPDMLRVMFGPQDPKDETLIYMQVDPEAKSAWLSPVARSIVVDIKSRGGKVEGICGEQRFEP